MKTTKALFGILAIATALAAHVHAQTILTNGLAAYYPFDGNATDESGNGMDGVVHGATLTADRFGLTNSAYRFNGTSWVQLPPEILLVPASEVTLSAWVLADSGPYIRKETVIQLAGGRGECGMGPDGAQWAFGAKLQNLTNPEVDTPMVTNVWAQFVGVYKQGQYLQLWVNGSLVQQSNGIPDVIMHSSLGFPLNSAIGIYDYAPGPYQGFNGAIDDVRIYNRALSDSEVQQLYLYEATCPLPRITSQPRNQVGYWGKSVTFTVRAAGVTPLSYQWQKDSVPLAGATGSSLVLTNLQATNAGNYSVMVTNDCGTNTSSNAYLTMNPAGVSLALYPGVTIDGVPGLTYGIQYTTDLNNTNSWKGAVNVTLSAPTMLWFDIYPATSQPQRYYRVVPGPISVP
jgi:hypothetical protein